MQTTRLCTVGVFSTTTMCCPCGPSRSISRDSTRTVGEQPLPEAGIDPGPRHDPGAVMGTDAGLEGLDPRVDRGGIDQALLDQDAFERLDPQRGI